MATNNSINAPFPIIPAQGGLGVASPTAHGILVAEGASAVTPIVLADGQLLIGSTGADPVAATLSEGDGITITAGSGTLTISADGAGLVWTPVSGTTQALAAGNGYISTGSALTTYTLPATAIVGDQFIILSSAANTSFSKIAQNAGQKIRIGSAATTAGTGGSLTGTAIGDALTFVCVDGTGGAEVFQVTASVGNFTVV